MSKRKKSVLVIVDDKSVLRTFRRILEKGGYDVEVAETGKEATRKIEVILTARGFKLNGRMLDSMFFV